MPAATERSKEEERKLGITKELNKAACAFDLQKCIKLIDEGADTKTVFRANSNGWYPGDSSTCLYNTISAFQHVNQQQLWLQEQYVAVVVLLLEKGSDPNFSAQSGNWNRSSFTPVFNAAIGSLPCLPIDLKVKFMRAFADADADPSSVAFSLALSASSLARSSERLLTSA